MAAYPKLVAVPEQVDEFAPARTHLEAVVRRLRSTEASNLTHGELEDVVTREGREVERLLYQGYLALRAEREKVLASVSGADQVERTHHRPGSRPLATLFGAVTVLRMAYSARGASSLRPLDAALNLPEERYSHGLRRLAATEAIKGSFDQTVEAIERQTGTKVPKRQVEELVARAAVDFDAFYALDERASTATPSDLLILSLDGKGLVMRHDDLREETQRRAEASEHKLWRRLSPGEKRNRKRMATVAAVYDLAPEPRQPWDVIAELRPVRDASKAKRPRAREKRVWASVEKSAEQVTQEVFAEALRRDPERRRRWVVLVDGDRHQIARVRAAARLARVKVTLVVDFIHVLEYLWRAAWCFFDQGDRTADVWVTERAGWVLAGQSGSVAGGIRRSATLRGLERAKREGADACADYLIAKRTMLHYDEYLAAGFPIATGVIEGACRHLINDRMDITGARWGLQGAEAVLRLRSLRSSGDLDEYWPFHLERERERNHLVHYAKAA
jgi:hypothetical protein